MTGATNEVNNMDMNVINKSNGKDYKVYDITYDNTGYPHFLIYKDSQWVRMSAKYFRPYSFEDSMKEFNKALNDLSKVNIFAD